MCFFLSELVWYKNSFDYFIILIKKKYVTEKENIWEVLSEAR